MSSEVTRIETARQRRRRADPATEQPMAWPGDPETVTAEDVDFTALAHVLANLCRHGGRVRRFHSEAAHALAISEAIEDFATGSDAERQSLALFALLDDARVAWLGTEVPVSQRAGERWRRLGVRIDAAVRAAAGLPPDLPDAEAELLRFVVRMAASAERRDILGLDVPGVNGGTFPPLKKRIRSLDPGRAAELWLARFQALRGPGNPPEAAATASRPVTKGKETDDEQEIPAASAQA